jgi:hypothetical protein
VDLRASPCRSHQEGSAKAAEVKVIWRRTGEFSSSGESAGGFSIVSCNTDLREFLERGVLFGIAARQGPQAVHMIGEDNPGVDAEGRTGAQPANRVAQCVDLRHQQIRTGVAQVHCKKEGSARNPIAAMIQNTGSMPGKALRFSALCLLWPTSHRLAFHLVAMSRTAPSYVKLLGCRTAREPAPPKIVSTYR